MTYTYDATKDNYELFQHTPETTARQAVAVTPSDTTPLTKYAKALYIGVTGDVTVIPVGGTTGVLFKAHPVGYFVGCQVAQVMATGTTATNIVALYD
jgi:hypothetical protein